MPLANIGFSLLDPDWHVVATRLPDEGTTSAPLGAGAPWTPVRAPDSANDGTIRGLLVLGGVRHDAVALPLADGLGYVAVHKPQAAQVSHAALAPLTGITFGWLAVLLIVTLYLGWAQQHETIQEVKNRSTSGVLRQTQELVRTRDAVIFALAKLAGFRDHETGGHLERISDYSSMLAAKAREHPKFTKQISATDVRIIGLSSVLHDIGKVGIEDAILRKRGPLTPAERERMEIHTVIAGDCLHEIAQRLGDSRFLQMAAQIALGHHERWDGTGYPNGLAGTRIPLCARIVAVVDVYDALSTPRVYKDPVPHAECVAEIRELAGKHFDPDLVEIWLSIADRFEAISRRVSGMTGGPSRFEAEPTVTTAGPRNDEAVGAEHPT